MLIDGKKIAQGLIDDLQKEFSKFQKVTVAAVVVGDDPASFSFLKQKQKKAQDIGIGLEIHKMPFDISEFELVNKIKILSGDERIKGLILQLPLPPRFLEISKILNAIPSEKDVDALSEKSIVLPPSVGVVKLLLEKYKINLANKKVVINGLGRLVGKPIYNWLRQQPELELGDLAAIEKDTSQKEREQLIKTADILISGVGKANLISSALIKKGAVVIDFGTARCGGKLCGDIEQVAAEKARLFTPTPGGTGPILVAIIFKNLLDLLDKPSYIC